MSIVYTVALHNYHAHIINIRLQITEAKDNPLIISLPAWIPGSYMVRDFAKNIIEFSVHDSKGESLAYTQLDKQTWQLNTADSELSDRTITIDYSVYAYDMSVRTAYVDVQRVFFNGSSLFFRVHGREFDAHHVVIDAVSDKRELKNWKVATTLPAIAVDERGFGEYCVDNQHSTESNYDALIDFPVEISNWSIVEFEVAKKCHRLVLTGDDGSDLTQIAKDLQKICTVHCRLFSEGGGNDLNDTVSFPDDEYLFLTMLADKAYGGLEHRNSTALLADSADLLKFHESSEQKRAGYIQFLGLCSHEYFHTWNIKRIKPTTFLHYQLDKEQYTDALWFYEGVTSYYDDLGLLRAGIITRQDYLTLLSHTITRVLRGQGRFKQTVKESSFTAWTKFYKQDENASNAIVSYYAKGALIALCLDAMIREKTNHSHSLDDVMRALWARTQAGKGADTKDIIRVCSQVAGVSLADFFATAVNSTDPLPLDSRLQTLGITMRLRPQVNATDKGGVTTQSIPQAYLGIDVVDSSGHCMIKTCHSNSPAMQAGLSAKDELVAINGKKASVERVWDIQQSMRPEQMLEIHVFRRNVLLTLTVCLGKPLNNTCELFETGNGAGGWVLS